MTYGRLNKDLSTSSKHRRAFSLSLAVGMFKRSMASGSELPPAQSLVAYAESLDEYIANGASKEDS